MPNEPCPNPSGVCHMQGCNKDSSQKWMGFKKGERGPDALKICKNCYVKRETAEKKALKAAMAKRAAQDTPSSSSSRKRAGDTLVKIIKILGTRCAWSLQPATSIACAWRVCMARLP